MSKIKFNIFEKEFDESGLTKAELARMVEVKPNALQGWFDRVSVPTRYLYEIADALKVNPRYLLGETDDKTRMQIIPVIGNSNSVVPSMPLLNNGQYRTIERHYFGKNVYAIIADTKAMETTIHENSLCLCNPDLEVRDGDIVHYSWGDKHGIAQYRISADGITIVLAPKNDDFDPIFVHWNSDNKIKMVRIFRIEQDL